MPQWMKTDGDVTRVVERVAKQYHPDIGKSGLTIGTLYAIGEDEDDNEPLTLNGYPCLAIVKKTPLRDRVAGLPDVQIFLDKNAWDDMSREQREALVDHELYHLNILRNRKQPELFRYDSANRPQVRMKLHDWQIGGFRAIAERHGDNAAEVIAARNVLTKHGQLLFEFAAAGAVS